MKFIAVCIFLFTSVIVNGQYIKTVRQKIPVIDRYLEKIYDSLKKKNVQDIITVRAGVSGSSMYDSLGPSDPYYIFWPSDTLTYFKQYLIMVVKRSSEAP